MHEIWHANAECSTGSPVHNGSNQNLTEY